MSDVHEDRYDALQRFTREAAELLGAPETSEKVQSLAALKLARLVQTERMVSGGNDTANLVALTETIAKFTPVTDVPLPTVELKIVHDIGLCPQCGYEAQDHVRPKPKEPPQTIDGTVAKPAPVEAKQLPPPEPPHPNSLPRKKPGSIHNSRLPDGTPARMRTNDYSGISPDPSSGGGSYNGNPFSVHGRPRPDFSAGHPLRDLNEWDVVPK